MSKVSIKDFSILSEQDKQEAIALLHRYDQIDKQDDCQNDFINFAILSKNNEKIKKALRLYYLRNIPRFSSEAGKIILAN